MKKILLLLLGGVLFITAITGCSNMPNKKSKKEIESLFSDFTDMFPMKDLDFLYDKELTENIEEDEVGLWQLSSYLYTADNDINKIGVNLSFDTKRKECYGNLYITKKVGEDEEQKAYPVYYKDSEILFVEESVNAEAKEALEDFKMLFELVDLNPDYLSSLKSTRHFYNHEVPLYGINYEIDENDENFKTIKKYYPKLVPSKGSIKMKLEGDGTPWNNNSSHTLYVELDENEKNWFVASLGFVITKVDNSTVSEN